MSFSSNILDVLLDHHPVRDSATEQVICWCLWKPEEKLWGMVEWDVVWEHVAERVDATLKARDAHVLLDAADAIQAMHPGEVKNSVLFLRQRAIDIVSPPR